MNWLMRIMVAGGIFTIGYTVYAIAVAVAG